MNKSGMLQLFINKSEHIYAAYDSSRGICGSVIFTGRLQITEHPLIRFPIPYEIIHYNISSIDFYMMVLYNFRNRFGNRTGLKEYR